MGFIQRVVGSSPGKRGTCILLACGHSVDVPSDRHVDKVVARHCPACLMDHVGREVVGARLACGQSLDVDSVSNEVARKILAFGSR